MDGESVKVKMESTGIEIDDRRRTARATTARKVVFSLFDGSGPIRQGLAVDIGAGGMRIRSPLGEQPGSELSIELRPKNSDGDVAILRGVVAFAMETGDDEFDMGVRLDLRLPAVSGAAPSMRNSRRESRRANIMTSSSRIQATRTTRHAEGIVAPKKRPGTPPNRKNRKIWAWAGPALVFFLLLLFIPRAATYLSVPHHDTSIRSFTLTRNAEDRIPTDLGHGSGTRNTASGNVDGVYPLVAKAASDSSLGDEGMLLGTLRESPLEIERSQVARFVVPLERALDAKESGDGQSLRRNILEALALDRVPEVWMDVARDVLTLDRGTNAGAIDDFAMGDTFDIEPSSDAAAKVADFHLEVDLSDYVLKVVRNGAILREFPVGLGYEGATPLGEFRIANKITDPAWYNRGEVVPAGDPANPLGRRWMGLGSGGMAISYGIHPTTLTDSIGRSVSRGCIRMFPKDAETLFRLCPLGTRVVIHE